MNKEIIELTKEAIKKHEDKGVTIMANILSLKKDIEEAERVHFKEGNIRKSLVAALEKLEEAEEKEKK